MHLPGIFYPMLTTNGTTSASSQAVTLGANTRILRIDALADTWVRIGPTSVAATAANGILISASNSAEYFRVNPGDVVTFLQVAAAGTISLTEMTP